MDTLTDKAFWDKYWKNHAFQEVNENLYFKSLIKTPSSGKDSFIELGGFPGYNCIYYKKYEHYKQVALFDFYCDTNIIDKLAQKNGLQNADIEGIEGDLMLGLPDAPYDYVLSCGLIEHFEDTKAIIAKHIALAKKNGEILITLPNLRGFNGWVQYLLDRENYNIHNIKCMDISLLKEIIDQLNVTSFKVDYFGKPSLWLEKKEKPFNSIKRKIIRLISMGLKLFPFKNKYFSPYIFAQITK